MSKKKVISWLLISTLFWMCTDESPPWREIDGHEAEGNEMVAVAKNLLAKNGNVLSLPDLSKKQVRKGRTRSVSYLTDATPAWAEARNDRRGEEQIVMIPLRGKEEIRSRVCIEREGENSYQFSKTFSRLVVRTKGESTVAHVMTYLPDAAYAESHEAELDTMGYFPGYIQFEGLVLVSSLNGTFLHALLYSKGRIVSKLQAPEEHVHTAACTHEHDGECDHGHEHKTIRLSLNLYSSSSSMTRATYSDGDEKIICSMCGKEDLVCECIVIEGEILYCDKCGAETFNCICGQEDLTKCQTCGNEPCTCHTNPSACPTCGAYPCVCGGSDGGDKEEGGGGEDNTGENSQDRSNVNLTNQSKFVGWYTGANCLDLAQKTLKNYGITDYGSRANAFRLTYEVDGKLVNWGDNIAENYQNAIDCIDYHLNNNRVLIVGVDYIKGQQINDGATDHFIVISGRGFDAELNQYYYIFMDNATSSVEDGCSSDNRLYYTEGQDLSGTSVLEVYYTVTQVRPNYGDGYATTYIPNYNE